MSEQTFAVVNRSGEVVNVIVADQAFIDALPRHIKDPDVDSGDLTASVKFIDVTDEPSGVSIGWKRSRTGKWTAPVSPAAEQDPEAQQRADDDAFLSKLRGKVADGQSLSANERDRLALIQLMRT